MTHSFFVCSGGYFPHFYARSFGENVISTSIHTKWCTKKTRFEADNLNQIGHKLRLVSLVIICVTIQVAVDAP